MNSRKSAINKDENHPEIKIDISSPPVYHMSGFIQNIYYCHIYPHHFYLLMFLHCLALPLPCLCLQVRAPVFSCFLVLLSVFFFFFSLLIWGQIPSCSNISIIGSAARRGLFRHDAVYSRRYRINRPTFSMYLLSPPAWGQLPTIRRFLDCSSAIRILTYSNYLLRTPPTQPQSHAPGCFINLKPQSRAITTSRTADWHMEGAGWGKPILGSRFGSVRRKSCGLLQTCKQT